MARQRLPRLLLSWDDDITRTRRRGSAMAGAVLHLALLILILLNPGFLSRANLVPVEAQGQPQQVTMLYLPSDLLEIPEPETQPDLTPEERQRAVIRKLFTVDRSELERILAPPPLPAPATPPGQALPVPPGAGGGEEKEESRGESEEKGQEREVARLEDLRRPERTGPSLLELPLERPGRAIEEGLRRSQGASPGAPPGAASVPAQPNLNTPFPLILSDTRGVDFGPYMIRLLRDIRRNWYAVIPESVRWGEQGRVVIVFTILKNGDVPPGQPDVVASSGRSYLDRPAMAAIRTSKPFPPLPEEFTGDNIVLQFTFLYNLPLDYTGP
ncbi:MAG: energy transducer TonB [Terriglobia bacterium]